MEALSVMEKGSKVSWKQDVLQQLLLLTYLAPFPEHMTEAHFASSYDRLTTFNGKKLPMCQIDGKPH